MHIYDQLCTSISPKIRSKFVVKAPLKVIIKALVLVLEQVFIYICAIKICDISGYISIKKTRIKELILALILYVT